MSLPTKCMACGKEPGLVAYVSDPFMDSSYALCRECLTPIYERIGVELRKTLLPEGGGVRGGKQP